MHRGASCKCKISRPPIWRVTFPRSSDQIDIVFFPDQARIGRLKNTPPLPPHPPTSPIACGPSRQPLSTFNCVIRGRLAACNGTSCPGVSLDWLPRVKRNFLYFPEPWVFSPFFLFSLGFSSFCALVDCGRVKQSVLTLQYSFCFFGVFLKGVYPGIYFIGAKTRISCRKLTARLFIERLIAPPPPPTAQGHLREIDDIF